MSWRREAPKGMLIEEDKDKHEAARRWSAAVNKWASSAVGLSTFFVIRRCLSASCRSCWTNTRKRHDGMASVERRCILIGAYSCRGLRTCRLKAQPTSEAMSLKTLQ